MPSTIKDKKVVHDSRAIKILQKDITKKILDCFNQEPKTASQIANSISFPKDKIYYHIKNLISFDILFIANKTIVKGIEQKSFFPTAKEFLTNSLDARIDSHKIKDQSLINISTKETNKGIKSYSSNKKRNSRKINERRRNLDRRILARRSLNHKRRVKITNNFLNDMRSGIERRVNSETRTFENRRTLIDRRILLNSFQSSKLKTSGSSSAKRMKTRSKEFTNTLLKT
ncbi:MAG: hypothetical protein ACJZ10_00040 [Candidatus Neomarinimicrobiota bacterium]